jgi:hypothetical protein
VQRQRLTQNLKDFEIRIDGWFSNSNLKKGGERRRKRISVNDEICWFQQRLRFWADHHTKFSHWSSFLCIISSLSFTCSSVFSHYHQPIDFVGANSQFQIPRPNPKIRNPHFDFSVSLLLQSINLFSHFLIHSQHFQNQWIRHIHSFNLPFSQSSFSVSVISSLHISGHTLGNSPSNHGRETDSQISLFGNPTAYRVQICGVGWILLEILTLQHSNHSCLKRIKCKLKYRSLLLDKR